jgi:transcription elongation factor Elf1
MTKKEQLREKIRLSVKKVWIGRRSLDPIEEQTNLLTDDLWAEIEKRDKPYYRCNKCGQSLSESKGVVCTQPMEVRTSGICGGSCTVEMTATEYYNQIIEWKDKELMEMASSTRRKEMDLKLELFKASDRIKELETVIDQQEEEIMDRNYFIAQLKSGDKKWVTEEIEDKLIKEGLKVKERINELEQQLNQKQ